MHRLSQKGLQHTGKYVLLCVSVFQTWYIKLIYLENKMEQIERENVVINYVL